MNKSILLSIIIPMYNCEKYIAECLDSILNSDLPCDDYEVIIINDGSKDHGSEIAQEYVARHGNFRYLTQDNQGQSVARNYGIKESEGEYIWCVDADDKIKASSRGVIDLLRSFNGVDILAFQLEQITESNDFISYECAQSSVTHNKVMKGREAILENYLPSSVCALLVRKQLMEDNHLFFKDGISQQDVELSYQLFAHADKVFFSDLAPYLYIHHGNSTSKSLKADKKIKYECDKIEIIKSFRRLSEKFSAVDPELSQKIRQYADSALFGCVYSLFRNRKRWREMGVSKAVMERLKAEKLYPLKGSFGSWKQHLASNLLNLEFILK